MKNRVRNNNLKNLRMRVSTLLTPSSRNRIIRICSRIKTVRIDLFLHFKIKQVANTQLKRMPKEVEVLVLPKQNSSQVRMPS